MPRSSIPLRALSAVAALACAACETIYVAPTVPTRAAVPVTPPVAARTAPPIPVKEIDLAGACRRTEEDGYREDATVKVTRNTVQALDWKLWISRRGTCEFHLAQFRQVKQTPHIELAATDGSECRLMVWQDPRRITIATENCEARCTNGVYSKAYPVLFDPSSGDCAKVR